MCYGGEISAVFLERLVFAFRVLIGDSLIAADRLDCLLQTCLGHALVLEQGFELGIALVNDGEKHMFHAGEVVIHFAANSFGGVHDGTQV